ncbi:MAG: arylsulfatase [Verrucomicrobiota bacterium]
MKKEILLTCLIFAGPSLQCAQAGATNKPNVIIILTDDQGYGDIGAHGHPFLKTPNLDKLHSESVRFTDFHVAPMCSPSRGQLMTGVDAMKTGCTAVCQGRSMVREDIPMLSNYFTDAGYATGIFGKWHMGDSYPYRPQDRGFQEVLSFRAWGLPSLASNWKNNVHPNGGDAYTDPVLEHNGVDTEYHGYSGDIWFTEAMKYMAECKQNSKPFFVYLPNNLAHHPDFVPEKYSSPYAKIGTWKGSDGKAVNVPAPYYGMIANIDENMGRLDDFLANNGLKENTIVLYSSDNGSRSPAATKIWNGGMRGHKTELLDGGHRVPLFFRWPKSGIKHGRDVNELTEMQDIAPTLLELCGIKPANLYPMSGVSLGALLRGESWSHADRKIAIQYRMSCERWVEAAALSEKWRLIDDGKSLYDVANDPHQDNNVAAQFPDVLSGLNHYYDTWHKDAYAEFQKIRYIHLGHSSVPEVILYASDWQGTYLDTFEMMVQGKGMKGYWDVEIENSGDYLVELSRWPFESGKRLTENLNGELEDSATIATQAELDKAVQERKPSNAKRDQGSGLPIAKAQLQIASYNNTIETKPEDKVAAFRLHLDAGKTKLSANFLDKDGRLLCSAYYVKVTRIK